MSLQLEDHWVWDHWILRDREQYHLFFLRASRALHDPERRHRRASIGHAVSSDARNWRLLPDAVVHSDGPAFDDLATWTGSAIAMPDGGIRLFYTGCSRAEDGLVQRISWVDSHDGITFERVGGQVLEADPRWYETAADYQWHDAAWRDPFVFQEGREGPWHMLITARSNQGDSRYRGVVGHAVSRDLDHWEILPPLSSPEGFGQLEVIQQRCIDGQHYLVFSVGEEHIDRDRYPSASTGGWLVKGESALGPWDFSTARPFNAPELYAGQLFDDNDGKWWYTGFRNIVDGQFVGDLPDPIPWFQV